VTRAQVRTALAPPVLAALGVFLLWGLAGLPDFGEFHGRYGSIVSRVATPERHTTNAVTAVVFDYRGFDTLGEEFILFAAVVGVVLLLRKGDEGEPAAAVVSSEQVRLIGSLMIGVTFLIGLWVIAFGFLTPGGGFQGGVVVAGAILLVFLTAGYRAWERLTKEQALDPMEGLGVGAFVCPGLATLVAGAPFLHDFLPPGRTGTLTSGGSLPILNWATALEVAAANVLLYAEFLEHYVAPIFAKEPR
jgi:multicomponent Na+:H+ antiporter subunit B